MIEIKNVTKTYNPNSRNENTVLKSASLTLPDNGLICIVGKSGIGKSTILNAIGGLISYDGEILFDGKKENIETYRKKNIGYIFQDFLLFPQMSVKDNIRIGLEIAGIYDEKETIKRTKVLLKAVGLNINMNRSAGALSLGQRQRVSIARALASNPRTILCDEPTGNLDSKNSMNVMRILKSLSKDHLIIMVTHNVNLVHVFADKAFAIENGVFKEIDPKAGTVDEIYLKNQINVSKFTRKDIQSEHVLLKLYSDPNCPDKEISIIFKDGKVLVVGDNVQVADNSEIQLIEEEQKQEQDDIIEEDNLSYPEQKLNFNDFQSRPTFKNTGFYREIKSILHPLARGKEKRRKKVAHVFEVIIPITIFLVLNLALGIYSYAVSTFGNYTNMDHLVALASDEGTIDTTSSQIINMLSDYKESHIIDHAYDNASMYYSEDSLFNNTYVSDTTVSKSFSNMYGGYYYYDRYYDGYDEGMNMGISSAVSFFSLNSTIHEKNYGIELKSTDFLALNDTMKMTEPTYVSIGAKVIVNDIATYSLIVPSLEKYDLNEGEVVLDKTIVDSLLTYADFPSGNKYDNIVGTKLRIQTSKNRTEYNTYMTLTIKGVEETKFRAMYTDSMTAKRFRMSNYCTYEFLPDIDEYEILDYDDIKNNADYVFDAGYDTYDGSILANEGGIPFAYLSIAAVDAIKGKNYNNDYSIWLDGLYTPKSVYVNKVSNPDKKLIVLRDYGNVDSYEEFYRLYLGVGIYNNSVIDDTGSYDVLVPSSLKSCFANDISSPSLKTQISFFGDLKISTYDETDPFGKIKISEATYFKLLDNHYEGYSFYASSDDTEKDRIYYAYQREMYVVSDDVGKTISYFENHIDEYHIKAYRVSYARSVAMDKSIGESITPFIVSIVFLAVVFVLILAIDSTSRINKEKYRFGVLRCLGMPKRDIFLGEIGKATARSFFYCLIPTLIIALVLSFFSLFHLSSYYLLFIAGYYLVVVLAMIIPLFFVLLKKPIDILHSLN